MPPTVSTRPPSHRRSSLGGGGGTRRSMAAPQAPRVGLSDRRLVMLAGETKAIIDWDRILRATEAGAGRWKWQETLEQFSIYTKHETQRSAVLAIGSVPCSVPELLHVLHASRADDFVQKMSALHGDAFEGGAFVHDVDLDDDDLPVLDGDLALTHLSVKTATFASQGWLARPEQWSFLDALHAQASGEAFELLQTSLRAADLVTGKAAPRRVKLLDNLVVGYLVQPDDTTDDSQRLARVHFYSELFTPKHLGFVLPGSRSSASERTVRARMLQLAHACTALLPLVRRRRLGVQLLVDSTRLLPPTNTPCARCDRVLLFAKLCRLCGLAVCDDCSAKHDRERKLPRGGRLRLERVRVCHRCMRRVDCADYSHLTPSSLMGPRIRPDAPYSQPIAVSLADLLQQSLLRASSPDKKASVLTVIKCLLDQEAGALQRRQRTVSGSSSSSTTSSSTPTPRDRSTKRIVLTSSSSEREHVEALRSQLTVEPLPAAQCGLAQADGRRYPLFPEESPDTPMEVLPTPTTEAARLRAIRETQVREVGSSEELNLICSIAAKELDCAVSMVTIVDENELFVAAANLATLEQQTFPRSDAFCAHTILDDQPTIIPHPEADVRFHQSPAVKAMGTRFYCGFPLVAEDDTIIGAVCCIDQKSRELTESQYAVMKKLATTASKVLKVQTLQRRGSDAKQSQPPAPRQQQWRRTASVRAA
ncbi:hypothetical protein ATCC90586_000536 [Pythium insidiosum]|nr:hypothetical protein ATCC90586_000536 [Pythium insidiosum]